MRGDGLRIRCPARLLLAPRRLSPAVIAEDIAMRIQKDREGRLEEIRNSRAGRITDRVFDRLLQSHQAWLARVQNPAVAPESGLAIPPSAEELRPLSQKPPTRSRRRD